MFITGENPSEALGVIKKARKNKLAFTVDILGEATLSEKEAQAIDFWVRRSKLGKRIAWDMWKLKDTTALSLFILKWS